MIDIKDSNFAVMTSEDRMYIARCLQLARSAAGSTSPNPMVGAVIVCDGRIIGEGYHIRCGEPHAEVNAIRSVKDAELLSRSTIYVSLEPCSHYGKTPPCADLIISSRIPRVVIATTDNNAMVSGRGIERMRAAGIKVKVGLLEKEAYMLNRHFFTYHGKKRPFVTLKWAQSADGFIDVLRDGGTAQAISTTSSSMAVHRLRAMHDAILVGRRTALLDNPTLTVRSWCGRSPLRLVLDRKGTLPAALRLFDDKQPTVVFTESAIDGKFGENVVQVELDFSSDVVDSIMEYLYANKIGSLLVEGGAQLLQSFIGKDMWDEIRVETNPSLCLGDGVQAPAVPQSAKMEVSSCFGNLIATYSR